MNRQTDRQMVNNIALCKLAHADAPYKLQTTKKFAHV